MTGYRGRIGIFELLLVDEAIRAKLAARSTASEIKSTALARGMKALRDDGIIKAFAGQTTIEEVLRVTMRANV
jgi:type II secretory ATPase GspE/PulE/Tfp pilus assembly ATPase PilB-like protein